MRVLLDTNIVLDYLGANHGFTEDAEKVIGISRSFNIEAQVVGRIEEGRKGLTIRSEYGEFNY